MRLGVFSDSHGNLDYLETAASYAVHKGQADVLIHLGDDYEDARVLNEFGRRLIRVPGVFSPKYQDTSVANRLLETFGPWDVLITHTAEKHPNDLPGDLDPQELAANRAMHLVLHGHTHTPRVERIEGLWFVNPGHLKREDKRGHPASFALLDLTDRKATAQIIQVVGHREALRRELAI